MICYISKNYRNMNGAGDKAKTDIEYIMSTLGFRNIGLKQRKVNNKVIAFFITLASILKAISLLRRNDVLILQYPLKKYYTFLCHQAQKKKVHVITLIHDLGSFRSKRLTIPQEVQRLNHSEVIIAHSENMKAWLQKQGVKAHIVVLGIFDYLSETHCKLNYPKTEGKPWRLVFAGALASIHNDFLYKMAVGEHPYQVVLYGNNFEKGKNNENIDYKGFTESDQLIETADGDFGLVWYGPTLKGGGGALGEYLQYNAPHKLSLYLRCGLPIIIWVKAGLAPLVKHLQIGLSSLEELNSILSNLTTEQYMQMKQNVFKISEKLSQGYFITHALREACKKTGINI